MYKAGLEARYASLPERIALLVQLGNRDAALVAASLSKEGRSVTEAEVRGGAARPISTARRPRHRVAQVRNPAVLAGFSEEALRRAYDAGRIARMPTHLTLHVGAAARDRETGRACRVVAKVPASRAWTVWFPGGDELVERDVDKLEAIEAPPNLPPLPARPMSRAAAPGAAASDEGETPVAPTLAAPTLAAPTAPTPAAPTDPPPGVDLNHPRVAEIRAMLARERAAAASDEAPAAPTPDGPTDRARLLAAQGPAVFDRVTETALGVPVGTSQAFEEAVAARSEKIRSEKSSQLVQHNFSEPEVRFVTGAWAPNIRNLAVAEILGDAAPSSSSPRDPSPDELAAMLQRFQLRGGNVNALLADANVAPMET